MPPKRGPKPATVVPCFYCSAPSSAQDVDGNPNCDDCLARSLEPVCAGCGKKPRKIPSSDGQFFCRTCEPKSPAPATAPVAKTPASPASGRVKPAPKPAVVAAAAAPANQEVTCQCGNKARNKPAADGHYYCRHCLASFSQSGSMEAPRATAPVPAAPATQQRGKKSVAAPAADAQAAASASADDLRPRCAACGKLAKAKPFGDGYHYCSVCQPQSPASPAAAPTKQPAKASVKSAEGAAEKRPGTAPATAAAPKPSPAPKTPGAGPMSAPKSTPAVGNVSQAPASRSAAPKSPAVGKAKFAAEAPAAGAGKTPKPAWEAASAAPQKAAPAATTNVKTPRAPRQEGRREGEIQELREMVLELKRTLEQAINEGASPKQKRAPRQQGDDFHSPATPVTTAKNQPPRNNNNNNDGQSNWKNSAAPATHPNEGASPKQKRAPRQQTDDSQSHVTPKNQQQRGNGSGQSAWNNSTVPASNFVANEGAKQQRAPRQQKNGGSQSPATPVTTAKNQPLRSNNNNNNNGQPNWNNGATPTTHTNEGASPKQKRAPRQQNDDSVEPAAVAKNQQARNNGSNNGSTPPAAYTAVVPQAPKASPAAKSKSPIVDVPQPPSPTPAVKKRNTKRPADAQPVEVAAPSTGPVRQYR
jgi:ribosomal protein L37AE/L43A